VARKDKPYRVYRGGRARGPIRLDALKKERREAAAGDGPAEYRGPKAPRKPRRRWLRRGLLVLAALIALVIVWSILGYLAFRRGVEDANERLDRSAYGVLSPQEGMLLFNPTTILVLGADTGGARKGSSARADSIMLVRTDPDKHRIAFLSIPRDLRVEIPDHGIDKVNAAYAFGGPALAVRTVRGIARTKVNHVVIVDFSTFGEVIDALGGVTINVPKPILSNRFDCPFKTPAECGRWKGWRFRAGAQVMDGHRALIYSRIRENQLDRSETDINRVARQQQVVQAVADEGASLGTFIRAPFIADDLVKPLATDLSASELVQLGWVKRRAPASQTIRCRLGGDLSSDGSFIIPNEEVVSTLRMFLGVDAPQPPRPGNPFGPGCFVGRSG
jgi:LCP family protein required for cell wall assembly